MEGEINIRDAQAFLDMLYSGLPRETLEFRLIYGDGKSDSKPLRKFVTLPIERDVLLYLADSNMHGWNIYFGVATRKDGKPWYVPALWVDIDFKDMQPGLIRPSVLAHLRLHSNTYKPIIVESGNGIHAYWPILATPGQHETVKTLNKKLAARFGGDSVSDVARILRLPGFYNVKDIENPRLCRVSSAPKPGIIDVYDLDDLAIWLSDIYLPTLDSNIEQLIESGDSSGVYPSRSEADFAVVIAMIRSGFSDEEIEDVFITKAIGAKYREKGAVNGPAYLARTIEAAKQRLGKGDGMCGTC